MAKYSKAILATHLHDCDHGATNQIKGKAFEDLACYLFETVPGVNSSARNVKNAFKNEEIDVAVWNDKATDGLNFLPNIVLIECKNWTKPVSSIEVSWFATKLQSRGLDFGILIASKGVTGNAAELNAAHNTISIQLSMGRRIIVITRKEINTLIDTDDMIELIKQKLLELVVGGKIA
jgi:predicted helicase